MSEATMTPTKAMAITREPERYTVQERKDAKKVLAKVGSEDYDFSANPERKVSMPASRPKKKPVAMPKPRPKNMSRGGMPKKYNQGGYANCGASVAGTQKN